MLRRILIGVAILLALGVIAAFAVDWEGLARGAIQRTLQERTGREVQLARVRLHARLPLRIELVGLRIANPSWAAHQPLLALQSADFTVRLLPLLTRREVVLPQVTVVRPEANLEQQGDQRSWVFGREPGPQVGSPSIPQIGALSVRDATLRYVDTASATTVTAHASQTAGEGGQQRLVFDARGRYKGEEINAEGSGASLLTLAEQGDPYPLQVEVRIGKTVVTFDGEVLNPAKLQRVAGRFATKGDNLEHLYRVAGVALPATPPYRVKGRLIGEGRLLQVEELEGGMGDSDISGSLSLDAGQNPPMLDAKLHSRLLDLDDLGPLIGAPPKTGPGETASAQQKRQVQEQKRKPNLVPEQQFNTERWGLLNARVEMDATRIRRQKWLPVDKLAARLTLRDRVIEIAPLRFGVADGHVDSTIRLDGRKDPLAVRVTTRFRDLRLDRLMPDTRGGRNSVGAVYGNAELAAQGASVKAMTRTLDGHVHLTLGPGRVSELVFEALGLDAAEVAKIFATGDDTVRTRCMIANLGIRQGVATSDALVFATADANVMGTGTVDIGNERLDLTLYTAPKDVSPLSFRAPLHLRGTFKDPQVRPDAGVLAAKAGAALLLGLVNPVLAVVPLIETGPGTDSSCGDLIRQAKGWEEAQDPTAKAVRRAEEKKGDRTAAPGGATTDAPRAAEVLREGRGTSSVSPEAGRVGAAAGGAAPGTADVPRGDAPRAEDVIKKSGSGG